MITPYLGLNVRGFFLILSTTGSDKIFQDCYVSLSRAIYGLIGVYIPMNQETNVTFKIKTPEVLEKLLSTMISKPWINFSMSDTRNEILSYHNEFHKNKELINELAVFEFSVTYLKKVMTKIDALINQLFMSEGQTHEEVRKDCFSFIIFWKYLIILSYLIFFPHPHHNAMHPPMHRPMGSPSSQTPIQPHLT